jgi:hypothetical protein
VGLRGQPFRCFLISTSESWEPSAKRVLQGRTLLSISTADAEFLVLGSKNQRYAFLLDRIGGRRVLRSTRYNSLQLQKGAAVTASTAVAPGTRIANLRRRAALRVHPPELVVPEVRESTCRPATGCACGPLVGRRQFGFEHRSPTRFATMSFVSLVNSSRAGISLES